MRCYVDIPYGGKTYRYDLISHGSFQCIELPGVVVLYVFKVSSHRYDLCGFFYSEKVVISQRSYTTKSKLHGAIQNLLQEYL